MTPNPYLWLVPLLPLAGSAINGFFGRQSSKKAISTVALVFCGAAFALALFLAAGFSSASAPYYFDLAHWLRSGDFQVDFSFYLDQLSLVMLLVVTGVGLLIHIYSVGYMWDDDGYYRFMSYLNLFMFFMLTLVLAKNYLVMFIGWERSEEHTSELQSPDHLVCRLLLEKKKKSSATPVMLAYRSSAA